jgi:hypothetical protein
MDDKQMIVSNVDGFFFKSTFESMNDKQTSASNNCCQCTIALHDANREGV